MVFPIAGGTQDTSYEVSNSLRFNDDDSPRLSKTFSSEGNKKTWSYSTWFKRGNLKSSGVNTLISAGAGSGTNGTGITTNNDAIRLIHDAGTPFFTFQSSQLLRDVSAWYHLLVTCDTTDGTAGDRVKFYLNGNNITSDMSYTNGSAPSQDSDLYFNDDVSMNIGARSHHNDLFFDGYMAETHLIDGTVKAPTDFGEFDDNGVWVPIEYTGTYGTNGFYLEFQQTGTSANSSGIGADTSGNDHHFTVNNLAATDITEDTCTNNFATLNSVFRSFFTNDGTYAEGNCERDFTAANGNRGYGFATFGVTSGKWYWEVKIPTVARANTGIGDLNGIANFTGPMYDENPSKGFIVNYNGQIEENATATSYASSLSDNDIVMWALDMDNHRAYYGINGTWQDSGDPTSGSTGTGDVTTQISDQSHLNTGEPMFPFCFDASTSGKSKFQWNFGNAPFSISSGNNDGKYGNFEYAPPSGYYALCTKRLAEFG